MTLPSTEDLACVNEFWENREHMYVEIKNASARANKAEVKRQNLARLHTVLFRRDGYEMDYYSLFSLKPKNYVNDEVLNGFTYLIARLFPEKKDDVIYCRTFDYEFLFDKARRYSINKIVTFEWFGKLQFFKHIVYMPVNVKREHWVLVEIDLRTEDVLITFWDSLRNYHQQAATICTYIKRFVRDAAIHKGDTSDHLL